MVLAVLRRLVHHGELHLFRSWLSRRLPVFHRLGHEGHGRLFRGSTLHGLYHRIRGLYADGLAEHFRSVLRLRSARSVLHIQNRVRRMEYFFQFFEFLVPLRLDRLDRMRRQLVGIVRVQRNVDVHIALPLDLAAFARLADVVGNHLRRLCNGAEKLYQTGAGEDHHRHKQQQDNHDACANRPQQEHQRDSKEAAHKARAGALDALSIEAAERLEEWCALLRRLPKDVERGAHQNDDSHHNADLHAHSSVPPFKRRDNGNVQQQHGPENGACPEQAHQQIM